MRGRGEIDVARVEFLELDASMGLRSRQGRGPPRPPRPRPPSRPPRRPGPPPPRPRRGRVTGIVIYLTLKRGRKQCRRSVLPPLSSPPHNSSQVGISTKSPNLQPKKIFALWKGFPPILCENPFQRAKISTVVSNFFFFQFLYF